MEITFDKEDLAEKLSIKSSITLTNIEKGYKLAYYLQNKLMPQDSEPTQPTLTDVLAAAQFLATEDANKIENTKEINRRKESINKRGYSI